MKFRQLLALCSHYLVSDQDFKKCCDEVAFFKLELYWNVYAFDVMDTTVIDCLSYASFRFQNVFFLDVRMALGLPQKSKLPIFNEYYVLQLLPSKKT